MQIQLRIRLRQAGRAYEFDVWHVECKALRNGLKTINILFLLIVAAFTFTICLLLSATFTEAEALMWVVGVVQSLVMQVNASLKRVRPMSVLLVIVSASSPRFFVCSLVDLRYGFTCKLWRYCCKAVSIVGRDSMPQTSLTTAEASETEASG